MKGYVLILGACYLFLLICCKIETYEKESCGGKWCEYPYYFAYFTDKQATPFSTDNPSAFLSDRAIERRRRQGISIVKEDLPVSPDYVRGLRAAGAYVHYTSRWFNGALLQCNDEVRNAIQALSYVRDVPLIAPAPNHRVPTPRRVIAQQLSFQQEQSVLRFRSSRTPKTPQDEKDGLVNATQNNMLGIDCMHHLGYKGQGVLIALLDAGFPNMQALSHFEHLYSENRLLDTYSFVRHQKDVYNTANRTHGTTVLAPMAAYVANEYEGIAHKAHYVLYETEDVASEYRIEEYNWLIAAERADSIGVDIIQSALGYSQRFGTDSMNYSRDQLNGRHAVSSRAANMAYARGILVVVSAGNSGNKGIGAPAVAPGALAVAALHSDSTIAKFSSLGPSADKRIKPDVSALGVGVASVISEDNYVFKNGTSFAAPLISSLAAGVWQAFPNNTNTQIADRIRRGSHLHTNPGPDNTFGHGIPNFFRIHPGANCP